MAVLDKITGLKGKTYTITGPASYATGGFLVDGSADFSWIMSIEPVITTRGVCPAVDYEIALNENLAGAEALGQGVVKLVREMYDKATIGAVSGLPGGTATQAAKFAAGTTTGSSHNHSMNHDHASVTSSTPTAAGTGVDVTAGGVATLTHTHAANPAPITTNTGLATHTHDRSFEYQHDHSINEATVDVTATEVAASTVLSATTFKVTVYGFGKL